MIAAQYILIGFGVLLGLFTLYNISKGRALSRDIFAGNRYVYKVYNKRNFLYLNALYLIGSLIAIGASFYVIG